MNPCSATRCSQINTRAVRFVGRSVRISQGHHPWRDTAAFPPAIAIALATSPCLSRAVPLPATPSTTPAPARFPRAYEKRSAGFSEAEGHPPSCTLLSTLYLKLCCRAWRLLLSGRQQGMRLRLRTRRSHSFPAPYSENRILESIVEADAINCYFGVLSTPPRCVAASSELRRTLGTSPSYTLQGSRWPVIRPLRPTRLQDVGAEGGGTCRPRDGARSWGNLGLEHVDPVKRRSR